MAALSNNAGRTPHQARRRPLRRKLDPTLPDNSEAPLTGSRRRRPSLTDGLDSPREQSLNVGDQEGTSRAAEALFDECVRESPEVLGIVAAADESGERFEDHRGNGECCVQPAARDCGSDVVGLRFELEAVKRQQRALQLVTAARHLCCVIAARLQALRSRGFHHWKGLIIERAARRRLHEHQISMKRELVTLRRSLALSKIIAMGPDSRTQTRQMVQSWGRQTRKCYKKKRMD